MATSDYREVIADLKREQLAPSTVVPHYRQRVAELERIIRERDLVTLPARAMVVRLASEAESAAVPSPQLVPPRLLGNTGEMAELLLPSAIARGTSGETGDDYSFAAASWTLAAHEGRPGHELQMSALIERGVSQARAIYAFNSVNVEGWAVYGEAEVKPYLPLDGQLISLQQRILRAARGFLDPGLQAGTITRDEAVRLLEREVVLSPALARMELERYTFLDPGQAASYFCGYVALVELRAEAARIAGERFSPRAFHDLVLAQGLLPVPVPRTTVLDEVVRQGHTSGPIGAGATR